MSLLMEPPEVNTTDFWRSALSWSGQTAGFHPGLITNSYVEVCLRSGKLERGLAVSFQWSYGANSQSPLDVIAYRAIQLPAETLRWIAECYGRLSA